MAAEDIITISVLLMVAAVGILVVVYSGHTMATNIATQPVVNQSSTAVSAFTATANVTHKFDILFLAAFIGLTLGLIILSWFVPAHPIFYIGYLLVMIISVILSAIMANVWESITANAKLATMLTYLPITNHIMLYLPLYIAVIGFVGITVMFAKPTGGSDLV